MEIGPREPFLDRLGPRTLRRPEPRLGTSLAGAGIALVVLGALSIGGDHAGAENGSQLPGVLLCLLVVAAGYAITVRWRAGALGAAGVAASALAVPPLMGFLTFDRGATPPLDFGTILLVSTIVWLGSYLIAPARGHNLYLGAGLLGLWLWLLEQFESLFSFPFDFFGTGFSFGGSSFSSPNLPDQHESASICLGVALLYLGVAYVLERAERRGMATPFVFVGLVALVVGVGLFADDLEEPGTGLVAVLLGVLVVWFGALTARRATSWVGAAAVWLGVVLLIDDVLGDSSTGAGVGAMVAGLAVVLFAHLLSTAWHEPDETVPGPSTFVYRAGSSHSATPPPPPAGSVLG